MAEIILVAKRHLVSAHNLIACRYNWRATACWRMIRVRLSRQRVWSGRRDLNPRQLAWEARTLPLSYARPYFYLGKTAPNPTPPLTSSQGRMAKTCIANREGSGHRTCRRDAVGHPLLFRCNGCPTARTV